MFSNEILEISLLNPEESDKCGEKKTSAKESCKTVNSSIENDTQQVEREPKIGIIKLGENSKADPNLVKSLMCEHCGKRFSKSSQLFVHYRVHTSKYLMEI